MLVFRHNFRHPHTFTKGCAQIHHLHSQHHKATSFFSNPTSSPSPTPPLLLGPLPLRIISSVLFFPCSPFLIPSLRPSPHPSHPPDALCSTRAASPSLSAPPGFLSFHLLFPSHSLIFHLSSFSSSAVSGPGASCGLPYSISHFYPSSTPFLFLTLSLFSFSFLSFPLTLAHIYTSVQCSRSQQRAQAPVFCRQKAVLAAKVSCPT